MPTSIHWQDVALILLLFLLMALLLAGLLFWWSWRHLRDLHLPAGAGFVETLRLVPLPVVLMLDLLDLALDIFAAPVAWVALSTLGLRSLRTVTIVEALIPGTQFIPTMTASWLAVRWLGTRKSQRPAPPALSDQGRS